VRISGLHIDGFGVFHEQGIEDMPPGLVLFTGNNESGKSTLMEFIRTVLFGFPRRPRNDYPPLRGGGHGGRLQLVMGDGRRITVERTGRRALIAGDGGGAEQAEPSDRLLGGIDRQVYESIFAIGLKDMQGLEVLSRESAGGRLFAAGAGLGASSVPETLETIKREMDGLLSQRGSKQRINDLLRRLRDIDQRIADLGLQSAEYAGIEGQRASLLASIQVGREEEERVRLRLRRVEQLRRGIEPWARLSMLRKSEAGLAHAAGFLPAGLERMESLIDQIERLKKEMKELDDKAARLKNEAASLHIDERVLGREEAIEGLAGEREKLASALREHPGASAAVDRLRAEFERRLREIGPEWDAGRLDCVDTSVQVRQGVQESARCLRDSESRHDRARSQSQAAEASVGEAERRFIEAQSIFEAEPVPPITDMEQARGRLEAARVARSLAARGEALRVRLDAAREAEAEARRRLERLRERPPVEARVAPGRLPAALIIAAVALGAVFLAQRSILPALVASAAAGVTAWLAFGLGWKGRREAAEMLAAQMKADAEEAGRALDEARAAVQGLEEQVAAISEEARASGAAGAGPIAGIQEAERMLAAAERAVEALRSWKEIERRKNEAESALDDARRKMEAARQAAAEAFSALQGIRDEWAGWLAARGFAPGIRPEGFEAVLQAVDGARAARRGLEDGEERARQLADYIASARARIASVTDACGRPLHDGVGGVEDVDALRRALEVAREVLQRATQLRNDLREAQSASARIGGALADKETAVAAMFEQAGARDMDEFRALALQFEEWRNTRREIEKCDLALRTIAGNEEARSALEVEMDGIDPVTLEAEEDALRRRLEEVLAEVSHDRDVSGRLSERLDQLSRSEDLGRLLLERNGVVEEIGSAARRWARLAMCRSLLAETRDAYERERQPEIIRRADGFLAMMVGDCYRVISSLGEGRIELEDASLRRKGEGAWSRGLAEQVYLAIRLGLAGEFARRAEPIPVILDDILVNFDPGRRAGAVRLILEFAREQQVLLFSCHPEMAGLIAEARGEAPREAPGEARRETPREATAPLAAFGHYSIQDGRLARVG